ncbi:MAG: DUF2799 domain-containing protein [Pseudomonadota bacterium]
MPLRVLFFVLSALAALSACSSDPARTACATVDWRALGAEDGAAGREENAVKKRLDACEGDKDDADPDLYAAGWAEGLRAYCTPERGFRAGVNNEDYEKVCKGDGEAAFLAEFEAGQAYFDAVGELVKAADAAAEARSSLSRHRTAIRSAKSRHENSYLSGDERYAARLDVEYHEREIQGLLMKLPKLEAKKRETETALKAMESDLIEKGRLPAPQSN